MHKSLLSLKNIRWKLYISLLVLGLCPAVYTTLRVFLLGQLPGEWAYSIAGQLTWVNLLYEILNEAIILPLFYFVGRVVTDREEFSNRLRSGMLATFAVYALLSVLIAVFARPLLEFMAADSAILDASASYIRIEGIANIFAVLYSFATVALVTLGREKYLYMLTGMRLVLCVLFDTFLVSGLPCSAHLGVNGIGVSNILVNLILLALAVCLLGREGVRIFSRKALRFSWMREFVKIGGISGLESLVRNLAYMLMVVRMVNAVGEQGTYWTANNFIWGWLLLPIIQLAELIKKDVAEDKENLHKNSRAYFTLTGIICFLWVLSIPLWKPFMTYVLQYGEVDKLFSLVLLLLVFYMMYAVQNVFDATFYGLGLTNYMLFESVVTNTVYYGAAFILYLCGVWTPSLTGIALLFGIGNAFDSIVSLGTYLYLMHKLKKGMPLKKSVPI